MKKLFLFFVLFVSISSIAYAKNTFTIEDNLGVIARYEVTPSFLDYFASFVRQQNADSKPFLTDIYKALQNGRDVVYNRDNNSIGGLYTSDWASMTPKELSKMYGRTSGLEATLNTKKHRFFKALSCFQNFYYYPR